MNINAIVSQISNDITEGKGRDDFRISQKQIRDKVHSLRASIIQEMDSKNIRISDEFYSRFKVTLTHNEPTGEDSSSIPKILFNYIGLPFVRYAGTLSRSQEFKVTQGNRFMYSGGDEYTGSVPTVLIEPYLLTIKNTTIKEFLVISIVENPDELIEYSNSTFNEDSHYPCTRLVIEQIINKATSYFAQLYYRMNPNQRNEAVDAQGLDNKPLPDT